MSNRNTEYRKRLFPALAASVLIHLFIFFLAEKNFPENEPVPKIKQEFVIFLSSPSPENSEMKKSPEIADQTNSIQNEKETEKIEKREIQPKEISPQKKTALPESKLSPAPKKMEEIDQETINTELQTEQTSEYSKTISDNIISSQENIKTTGVDITSFKTLTPRGTLPSPPYPDRARKLGYEGKVVLEITISSKGKVTHVELLESDTEEILIRSCIETVRRKWRFQASGKEEITHKTFLFRLK